MTADSPTAAARAETRPLLRGVSHLVAAVFAPVGLVFLLLIANSPTRYVGAAIFASSLIVLYTTSASYHVLPWSRRLRGIVMRADHATIFVLIAGTYTPFSLVTLNYAWGIPMLSVVWSLAGAGILLKIAWPRAPRWPSVGLYLALGWIGVIPASQVASGLPAAGLAMLLTGGVLYSVGGLVYAARWPDPFPRVFGFHEVFHALVVAGSLVHFALIAAYVVT